MNAMRYALLTLAALLVSVPAAAQSVEREISVNGWTATGNEFVSVATSQGESEEGDFSYSLLQVHDANTGARLRRFRYGASQGPAQPAFQDAEAAPEGRTFMLNNPPTEPADGNVSPDGRWYLDAISRSFVRPAQTVECPECRTCTTQYQVFLIDTVNEETLVLDTGNRDGTRITAPMEPQCVEITASGYWNESDDRFALILHETVDGGQFDSLSLYNLGDEMLSMSASPLVRVERALPRGVLRQRFDDAVGSLSSAPNRQHRMRELIQIALDAGDVGSAGDYLEISMANSPDDTELEFMTHMLDFLGGNERALRSARRSARDADGALDHELGLLYYLNGDLDDATELLGQMTPELALEIMRYDVGMGIRAFENATLDGRNADAPVQRMLAQLWFETGRTSEATRMVQGLDQEDPANLALILRALVTQDRAEEAYRLAYERLFETPGNCELYELLGDGELAAGNLEEANELYTAGQMCDPNLYQSLYTRATRAWGEQSFDDAIAYGREFARIIGARRGDSIARGLADEVGTYRARAQSPDLILWDYSCSGHQHRPHLHGARPQPHRRPRPQRAHLAARP